MHMNGYALTVIMSLKHKRNYISLEEKYRIIKDRESGKSTKEIIVTYGLKNPSNVTRIMKKKSAIIEEYESKGRPQRKSLKGPKSEELDKKLLISIKDLGNRGIVLSYKVLKDKALQIAEELKIENFHASNGFVDRFLKRHGVVTTTIHGDAASVSEIVIQNWKSKLPHLLGDFKPEDIYNADEFGLFYQLTPSKTLPLKGEICAQRENSITVLLGTNMTGTDKLMPFVVGKSEKPVCIKHMIANQTLPLMYQHHSKAWITGKLFCEYLTKWNVELKKTERKVLLFIDNCPAHSRKWEFSNIKILCFPPNTSSILQPMNLGIIRYFKAYYRKRLLRKIVMELAKNTDVNFKSQDVNVNLYDAMCFTIAAWKEVSENTIKNSFNNAGFPLGESTETDDNMEEFIELLTTIAEYEQSEQVDFQNYLDADNDIITCDFVDEILDIDNLSECESAEVEDVDETKKPIPTILEAFNALDVVKRYCYNIRFNPTEAEIIDQLEKSLISSLTVNFKQI